MNKKHQHQMNFVTLNMLKYITNESKKTITFFTLNH